MSRPTIRVYDSKTPTTDHVFTEPETVRFEFEDGYRITVAPRDDGIRGLTVTVDKPLNGEVWVQPVGVNRVDLRLVGRNEQ